MDLCIIYLTTMGILVKIVIIMDKTI